MYDKLKKLGFFCLTFITAFSIGLLFFGLAFFKEGLSHPAIVSCFAFTVGADVTAIYHFVLALQRKSK